MPNAGFLSRPIARGYGSEGIPAIRLALVYEGREIGRVHYEVRPESLHVRWIEVLPAMRRNGIGSMLMREMRRRHPEVAEVSTSGFTDEGEPFWQKVA